MTRWRQILSTPCQPLQVRRFLAPAAFRPSVHVAHPVMPRLYLASALSRSHTHALLPSGPLQYLLQAPVASVTCTLSRRGAQRRTRARRNLTPWTRVMTSPIFLQAPALLLPAVRIPLRSSNSPSVPITPPPCTISTVCSASACRFASCACACARTDMSPVWGRRAKEEGGRLAGHGFGYPRPDAGRVNVSLLVV